MLDLGIFFRCIILYYFFVIEDRNVVCIYLVMIINMINVNLFFNCYILQYRKLINKRKRCFILFFLNFGVVKFIF